jgi:hypothetical protein
MNGPWLREKIFGLNYELDCCQDPTKMPEILHQLEDAYDQLVTLTGETREYLESAIADAYPQWARKRSENSGESSASSEGSNV